MTEQDRSEELLSDEVELELRDRLTIVEHRCHDLSQIARFLTMSALGLALAVGLLTLMLRKRLA